MAKRSGLEQLVRGLLVGGAAFGLWFFHIINAWWLFPVGLIFGALPFLRGVTRSIRTLEQRRHERHQALVGQATNDQQRKEGLEKTVLKIAKKREGVVTPATVVLESDLTLQEAEQVLQSLASRGYAEMRVKDNGTIDYVFHGLA